MNKTLLVLAASTYQITAIEAARNLGYRVITTDNSPSNPGHALSHASFNVDTTDEEGVLRLAKRENISGVIAPGTDVAVMTAAYVAENLQLPGPPCDAARALTSKQDFRKFLHDVGLPCPRAFPITSHKFSTAGLFDGRSWLVKPSRSSGSKGIFIVRTESEFAAHISECRAFSMDGTAVMEEFIEGTQHTCEGVLKEGKVTLALITDRDTVAPPYTATIGHRVPSRLSEVMQAKAILAIEDVLCRLGVIAGPFDCDFVSTGEQVVLIEITPRLGGNSLSKLFKASLDFDLVAYAVRYACGDFFLQAMPRRPKPAAVAILGVAKAGRLCWNLMEAEALRCESWVDTLLLDLAPGAPVQAFINGRHRVGEALITGVDRDDVDTKVLDLKRRLALSAIRLDASS